MVEFHCSKIYCEMIFPVEIPVFGGVRLHTITEVIAYSGGFRYFLYLRKHSNDPISDSNRMSIFIGAIFGSLLGSHILGSLELPREFLEAPSKVIFIAQNKTVLGGLLGGLFGVEAVKKIIGEKQSSGDLMTYPLLSAMTIGRVGCFFNGVFNESKGIVTPRFVGMDMGDGLARYPVALFEVVFLLLLQVVLRRSEKSGPWKNGIRFQFFMIGYLVFRFSLEFIKEREEILFNLGTIQLACLGGLLYYYRTIYQFFSKITTLRTHVC